MGLRAEGMDVELYRESDWNPPRDGSPAVEEAWHGTAGMRLDLPEAVWLVGGTKTLAPTVALALA